MGDFITSLISVIIIFGFGIFVYLKFTKKTFKEFVEDIKELNNSGGSRTNDGRFR